MTTRFKIEEEPNFTAVVKLDRASGETIDVTFRFKYFTQDELGELNDEWQKRRDDAVEEAKGRDLSNKEWSTLRRELEFAELNDVVEGWSFDDEYNEESLRKFIGAISTHYGNAMLAFTKGLNPARVGN